MKFEPDRSLFPFDNRFFTTSGGSSLHYVDEGRGQPILLLHGNPTWSFLYRKMILALRPAYRCIAPDYPGFGLSEASRGYDFRPESHVRAIGELFDDLKLKNVVVVMQDWGGPIGLKLAQTCPDRIDRLVIGNTWAWPLRGEPRFEIFSWLMGGPAGQWMATAFNGVWRSFMARGFATLPAPAVMEMYRAPFRSRRDRLPTAIFPRQLVQATALMEGVERGLGALRKKQVLLLWGSRDFAFKGNELARFKQLFPTHAYRGLDAGHFWPEDQGELAARIIDTWMRGETDLPIA